MDLDITHHHNAKTKTSLFILYVCKEKTLERKTWDHEANSSHFSRSIHRDNFESWGINKVNFATLAVWSHMLIRRYLHRCNGRMSWSGVGYANCTVIHFDQGMDIHFDQDLGWTYSKRNAFTACANGEDSDQPVHLQSIYMASLNVLHFITLKSYSSILYQWCVWTVNMAIRAHLVLALPLFQLLCNIALYF